MPAFRVEPTALEQHGASINRIDSFDVLAEVVADRRSLLDPLSVTSAAIDALERRLFERLIQLSSLTDSVGTATRTAADLYATVDSSILAASGHGVHGESVE